MKKKDRIIVAVIVALSMVVGLVLVYRSLAAAEHSREKLIHSIWSQREETTGESTGDGNPSGDSSGSGSDDPFGDGSGSGEGDDPFGDGSGGSGDDPFGDGSGGGGDDPFGDGSGSGSGDSSGDGSGGSGDDPFGDGTGSGNGDSSGDGSGNGGDDPFGDGSGSGNGGFSGDGSGSGGDDPFGDGTGSGDDDSTGSGGTTAPEEHLIVPNYGDPPVLSASALTAADLVDWMTTASAGALEAEASLDRESAVAAGKGSENDPDRRAFAQTQSGPNHTARLNALEEEGVRLAMDFLRTRDAVELEKENLAFYEGVEQTLNRVMAENNTDPVCVEFLGKDQKKLQEKLDSSRLSLDTAKVAHQTAAEALCTATGNDVSAGLTILGELSPYAPPGFSVEEAVSQALSQRNELQGAQYRIIRAQKALTQLRYEYAPTSPEIVAQQVELSQAQAAYPETKSRIEAGIREKMGQLTLSQQKQEQIGRQLKDRPAEKPVYHFEWDKEEKKGSDEEVTVCTSNMDELLGSWSKEIQIRLQLVNEVAQYNLSVVQLQHAAGVGCVPALI